MNTLNFKKYLLGLVLANLFLAGTNLAYAAESVPNYNDGKGPQSSIEKFLCHPTDSSKVTYGGSYTGTGSDTKVGANNIAQNDLYSCINQLYKFAITIASVAGVLMIVIAGYLYMSSDGNQESVDKAKSIVLSTITAMVILFAGYVILKTLNPDLIKFQSVQPPSVTLSPGTPPPTGGTGGTVTGSASQLASQILGNSKISLATSHVSGVNDNATAKQNIQDVANGQMAHNSCYSPAPCKTTALNEQMLGAISQIAQQYTISISEIAGGSHSTSATDSHYVGKAFDINYVNGQHLTSGNQYSTTIINLCKQYGASFAQYEAGANHVHCQW